MPKKMFRLPDIPGDRYTVLFERLEVPKDKFTMGVQGVFGIHNLTHYAPEFLGQEIMIVAVRLK